MVKIKTGLVGGLKFKIEKNGFHILIQHVFLLKIGLDTGIFMKKGATCPRPIRGGERIRTCHEGGGKKFWI